MEDYFGIAARLEAVAASFEIRAQLQVVVDLTVAFNRDCAVLVCHRLVPASDVDDREPTHAHPHAARTVEPLIVRTAVLHRIRHHTEFVLGGRAPVQTHHAADAAHR